MKFSKTTLSAILSVTIVSTLSLNAANIVKIPAFTKKPAINYAQSEAILQLRKNAISKNMLTASFKNLLDRTFGSDNYKVQIFSSFWAMHIKVNGYSTKDLLKIFKNSSFTSFVESASPNYINSISQATNDTYYSKLWAVENTGQNVNNTSGTNDADMDTKEAWDIESGNKNVIVAVLDTGVDYTHEDLKDNMYNGNAKHGYDFAGDNDGNNDDDPMPDTPYDENGHYHGTHVAGIIGAVGNNGKGISGVAQRVSIMALKVFRPNGYGYNSDILEALDYISKKVDNGENIVAVNASFGGSGGSQDDSMDKAIEKLGSQGVVFCAAAGNDSKNIDNDPVYPASYDASNIIAVAATDQNDQLASFSNWGKNSVDIAAPGKNILSAYPENKYAYMDGTSMATPQITGLVALLKTKYPSDDPNAIKDKILNYGDELSSLEGKIASNARANSYKALIASNEDPNKDDEDQTQKNNPPQANDDQANVKEGESVTIKALENDSDPDGDEIKIVSVENPSCGSVSHNESEVVFDAKDCDEGTYRFKYRIEDTQQASDEATIEVKVEAKENNNGWGFFGGGGNSGWFF